MSTLFYFQVIYFEVKKNKNKITQSLYTCTGEAIILSAMETNGSTFILHPFFVPEKNYLLLFIYLCVCVHIEREEFSRNLIP